MSSKTGQVPGGSDPYGIATGADGALWFTNYLGDSIDRITTAGAVTSFSGTPISSPGQIAPGADHALWFTNSAWSNSIGRISTDGIVTSYKGAGTIGNPWAITAGPDRADWFTDIGENVIERIGADGSVVRFADSGISQAEGIAAGPDGALWFTNYGNNSIERLTTDGVFTTFTDPELSHPYAIAAGPDGAMWFTATIDRKIGTTTDVVGAIGRITVAPAPGVMTLVPDSRIHDAQGIAAGPDGAMWFTNYSGNSIGRITTSGEVSNFTAPGLNWPIGIAQGPDGTMWFTDQVNAIGRITTG